MRIAGEKVIIRERKRRRQKTVAGNGPNLFLPLPLLPNALYKSEEFTSGYAVFFKDDAERCCGKNTIQPGFDPLFQAKIVVSKYPLDATRPVDLPSKHFPALPYSALGFNIGVRGPIGDGIDRFWSVSTNSSQDLQKTFRPSVED
jgi:hypothetical protein